MDQERQWIKVGMLLLLWKMLSVIPNEVFRAAIQWFCKECCVVMQTSNQMITWALMLISELLLAVLVLYSKCGVGCLWSSVLLPCLGAVLRVVSIYFCVFHSLHARVTQWLLWLGEEISCLTFAIPHQVFGPTGITAKLTPRLEGLSCWVAGTVLWWESWDETRVTIYT